LTTKGNHESTKSHDEHEEDNFCFFVTFERFVSSIAGLGWLKNFAPFSVMYRQSSSRIPNSP
jgi:hypothetical protein